MLLSARTSLVSCPILAARLSLCMSPPPPATAQSILAPSHPGLGVGRVRTGASDSRVHPAAPSGPLGSSGQSEGAVRQLGLLGPPPGPAPAAASGSLGPCQGSSPVALTPEPSPGTLGPLPVADPTSPLPALSPGPAWSPAGHPAPVCPRGVLFVVLCAVCVCVCTHASVCASVRVCSWALWSPGGRSLRLWVSV